MLIDTHVHLYLSAYDGDRDAVVHRAREAGVGALIQPAVDVASIDDALDLCRRYDGVYAMAALHPTYVADAKDDALKRIATVLSDSRVKAVGESGLDYYWSREHEEAQRDSLRAHAHLALEHDLPLVLHNRDRSGSEDASTDLVQILREVKGGRPLGNRLRGVFHCFGGPRWLAADVLDLGFHIGLGGTLTFKNGGVPEAIGDVPLDRIVLETDGPYLAPTPYRGQRNEPAYLERIASRLAEVRDLPVDAVAQQTTQNARALFNLPESPLSLSRSPSRT